MLLTPVNAVPSAAEQADETEEQTTDRLEAGAPALDSSIHMN